MATLKPQRRPDPLVRFETAAGQQMQVDWGNFRLGPTRLSAFVATLGFSRCTFGMFVGNEQFLTLRNCHEQAFDEFGGVPREVLYDNKSKRTKAFHASWIEKFKQAVQEKRAMARIWKQREKQIDKVLLNTTNMYGSIKGIAGNAIPAVRQLELPAQQEDEENGETESEDV